MATDKKILIQSKRQGGIYCMPIAACMPPKKGEKPQKTKGFFLQQGYSEISEDQWAQLREDFSKEITKGEIVEIVREIPKLDVNGKKTGTTEKAAPTFKQLDHEDQLEVIGETLDTDTLKKWGKLKGLDAAISNAIKDQLKKINSFGKDEE